MTAAVIALALGLVASPALCLHVMTRYLTERDKAMWDEFRVLANRIQAPETAVAQTIAMELPEPGPPNTEWTEMAQAHDEFLAAMTEEIPSG